MRVWSGRARSKEAISRSTDKNDLLDEWLMEGQNWFVRNGIFLLFVSFTLSFSCVFFLKFPDTIKIKIKILTKNPPIRVVARMSGKIQKLTSKEGEMVWAGQTICLLDNPASFKDIKTLKALMANIITELKTKSRDRFISLPSLQVGELQVTYTHLCQSIRDFKFVASHGYSEKSISRLNLQYKLTSLQNEQLKKQSALLLNQLHLEYRSFYADSLLFSQNVISLKEFEESKKKWIRQNVELSQHNNNVLDNSLHEQELKKSVSDVRDEGFVTTNRILDAINQDLQKLFSELANWENKYLVESPINGRLTFTKYWTENQFVRAGDTVVIISPVKQNYIGKGTMPVDRAGKVKIGNLVLVRLAAYPSEDFGMIQGRVSSISSVAENDVYIVSISLNDALITTSHKMIPQQPELQGEGEISSVPKSIFNRLIDPLISKRSEVSF